MTTIAKITIQDFGGIEIVETSLHDGVNIVEGNNGSGKSTFIAAIARMLVGKKAGPEIAVRQGADVAIVKGEFSDGYRIEIRETAAGTYSAKLTTPEGHLVQKPQDVLDKLRGYAGADPLALIAAPAKDVRGILLDLLGIDVSEIDQREAALRSEREACGREGKTRAGALANLGTPVADVPEAPVSASELMAQLDEIVGFNRQRDAAERARVALERQTQRLVEDQDKIRMGGEAAIRRAQEALRVAEDEALRANRVAAEMVERSRAEFAALPPLPDAKDEAPLRAQIAQVDTVNAAVRRNEEIRNLAAQVEADRTKYAGYTSAIVKCEKERAEKIAAADAGIEGLELTADGVMFKGLPLSAASTGEKLKIVMALVFRSNRQAKVIWSERGDCLDDSNLEFVNVEASARGWQVILERTGERKTHGAIVIRSGKLGNPWVGRWHLGRAER